MTKAERRVIEQAVYKRCASIAKRYNKTGVSEGIQMGVAVAGAAICKEIQRAALNSQRRGRRGK